MTKEELITVKGGASLTASLLNAVVRGANLILQAGQYAGSAFKRLVSKNYC